MTGWRVVDVALAAYAVLTGGVIAIGAPGVTGWPWLLLARLALLAGIVVLARRGGPPLLRELLPLALLPLLFWEAPLFANALWERAWWLEAWLLAWDRALFGAVSTPAAFGVPGWGAELLWALYFAYYPIVGGGLLLAALDRRAWRPTATAAVLGFLGAFALFPFFPARAPVHAVAVAEPAAGFAFARVVVWIQGWGGVTGSAFPSAHVSAAWAIVMGLAPWRPRAALLLGITSAGMTAACVWSPYHWAADALAGLSVGLLAGTATWGRFSEPGSARAPRGTGPSTASGASSPGRA